MMIVEQFKAERTCPRPSAPGNASLGLPDIIHDGLYMC